jgi:hypothetical protein
MIVKRKTESKTGRHGQRSPDWGLFVEIMPVTLPTEGGHGEHSVASWLPLWSIMRA